MEMFKIIFYSIMLLIILICLIVILINNRKMNKNFKIVEEGNTEIEKNIKESMNKRNSL